MTLNRTFRLASSALLGAGFLMLAASAEAQQTGTINLQGSRAINCTISVTPHGNASALPFDLGVQRTQVGSILQNCNKKVGYKLWVASQNCSNGVAGAKLLGTPGPNQENQRYTVEFTNPLTGGSLNVTGLLNAGCDAAPVDAVTVGRAVSNYKVNAENSTVYVNYTVAGDLAADTYTDVLTINMTVN